LADNATTATATARSLALPFAGSGRKSAIKQATNQQALQIFACCSRPSPSSSPSWKCVIFGINCFNEQNFPASSYRSMAKA